MPVKHVAICSAVRATHTPLAVTLPAFLWAGMVQCARPNRLTASGVSEASQHVCRGEGL
jgi:hypothetical protein